LLLRRRLMTRACGAYGRVIRRLVEDFFFFEVAIGSVLYVRLNTAFIRRPFRLRFQIWVGGKCNRTLQSSIARRATLAAVSLSNKGVLLYLLCNSIRSHYWMSPGEWRRLHCIVLDATSHIQMIRFVPRANLPTYTVFPTSQTCPLKSARSESSSRMVSSAPN